MELIRIETRRHCVNTESAGNQEQSFLFGARKLT